jgi:predicted CoA-substrate-specific enzyme activase
MLHVVGIDVGSTQTKGVVLDEAGRVAGRALLDLEYSMAHAAETVFTAAVENAGLRAEDIAYIVATGYGRYRVTFGDAQVTEISCHARGAVAAYPATRVVLDIGGQDTKAIKVTPEGEVANFAMNDKCAAGTGRFLGAASSALELELSELGPMAMRATNPVTITTTCTVFAESEIIGHLSRGRHSEDVVMGMHYSVAKRCSALVRRVGLEPEVTFTGGVSRNVAMVALLTDILGTELNVSPDAHFTGAIGAGLFALDRARAGERGQAAAALTAPIQTWVGLTRQR